MTEATPEENASTGLRVLIVEDEASAREATRRYLEFLGYQVASAASAREAESTARRFVPEVVICDWRLAGNRDGIDVARQMHGSFGAAIIFVTAYPLDELQEQTADMAVLRYFKKPLSLNALADTLGALERQDA